MQPKTSELVLSALASTGLSGTHQSDFSSKELSALARLARKGLVIRDEDKLWFSIAVLEEKSKEANLRVIDMALAGNADGIAPVSNRIDIIRTTLELMKKKSPKKSEVAPKKEKKSKKPKGGWPIILKEKVCSKGDNCVTSKKAQPIGNFYKDSSNRNGVISWCKRCTKAHTASKRAAAKETS